MLTILPVPRRVRRAALTTEGNSMNPIRQAAAWTDRVLIMLLARP